MRFGIFVSLFLSALAGIGFAQVQGRFPRHAMALMGATLLLLCIDLCPRLPHSSIEIKGREVDHWLAKQSGEGAVLQFPVEELKRPEQTYFTSVHVKPFVGGFFAGANTSQYRKLLPTLRRMPDPNAMELIRQLGVEWILIDLDKESRADELSDFFVQTGLALVGDFDGQRVFHLIPST